MTILALRRALTLYFVWHAPLAAPPPPLPGLSLWNGGRIYTSEELHVGVRPALDWGAGASGFTVQFTWTTPW